MNDLLWTVIVGLIFLAMIMVIDAIIRRKLLEWRIRKIKEKHSKIRADQ